jgi:hypothetical protein
MLHPVQVCEPIPSPDLTAALAPPRTDSRSLEAVQTPPASIGTPKQTQDSESRALKPVSNGMYVRPAL